MSTIRMPMRHQSPTTVTCDASCSWPTSWSKSERSEPKNHPAIPATIGRTELNGLSCRMHTLFGSIASPAVDCVVASASLPFVKPLQAPSEFESQIPTCSEQLAAAGVSLATGNSPILAIPGFTLLPGAYRLRVQLTSLAVSPEGRSAWSSFVRVLIASSSSGTHLPSVWLASPSTTLVTDSTIRDGNPGASPTNLVPNPAATFRLQAMETFSRPSDGKLVTRPLELWADAAALDTQISAEAPFSNSFNRFIMPIDGGSPNSSVSSSGPPRLRSEWTCDRLDLDSILGARRLDSPVLALPPRNLAPGGRYKFGFRLWDARQPSAGSSRATVVVEVNRPPVAGSCSLEPKTVGDPFVG